MSTKSKGVFPKICKDSKILLKPVEFSQKLHKELQDIENEVNWNDILKEENSYEVISSMVNQFVHDIHKLIYNLHQIMIKINKHQSSYNDLKILVKSLTKTSFDLQDAFGEEHSSVLKSKLSRQLQNIVKEVQSLLSIIEKEELYEFKTELVDFLSEILSDIQKVMIYNHLKQLTPVKLLKVFNSCEQECRNIVNDNHHLHEATVDTAILEKIARHTFHGIISAQRIAFNLHQASNSYKDPIKTKINEAAKNLNNVCMDITVGMYQMKRGGEGTSPLEKCMVEGFQAFRDIMNLIDLVNHCEENGKDSENLKNLVFYGLSNGLSLARRYIRDMKINVLDKM